MKNHKFASNLNTSSDSDLTKNQATHFIFGQAYVFVFSHINLKSAFVFHRFPELDPLREDAQGTVPSTREPSYSAVVPSPS